MRRILAVGLVALAAACGGETEEKPIQYGAPQAPTSTEQSAVAGAHATLQGSLAYQASAQPTAGAAGLGDQLVASLGGYAVSAKMPSAWSAKVAGSAVRQAFETGGMDPACVTTQESGGVTTVTWARCQIDVADADPATGDTMTLHVVIDGSLTWEPAAGRTSWRIGETMAMTMTSDGQTITADGIAGLVGSTTVTASTIVANTSSNVDVHMTYMGMRLDEALVTTLAANLGYQADPFCIASGTLAVEQRWTKRPAGATEQTLPNQGWRFEWTGCGQFTVAHGS